MIQSLSWFVPSIDVASSLHRELQVQDWTDCRSLCTSLTHLDV